MRRQAGRLPCAAGAHTALPGIIRLLPPQNPSDVMTPEVLEQPEIRTASLRTTTANLQAQAKTLRTALSSLNSSMSTPELRSRLLHSKRLEKESAKRVTQTEQQQVESEWKKWRGVCLRREKIATKMWEMIEDSMEDKKKEGDLRESLGLDD
jgi:26S proteasome regulatory subunit, ATPase 3, interacting protein